MCDVYHDHEKTNNIEETKKIKKKNRKFTKYIFFYLIIYYKYINI